MFLVQSIHILIQGRLNYIKIVQCLHQELNTDVSRGSLNKTQFLFGGFQHLGGFTAGSMTPSSHHAAAGRKKTGGPRKAGRMDLFFFDLFIYFHCARSVKHDSYSCWTISRTLLGDVNVVSHSSTVYNTHTHTHTFTHTTAATTSQLSLWSEEER